MNETARFAADSLHKEYPEPDQLPEDALLILVLEKDVFAQKGNRPTLFIKNARRMPVPAQEYLHYLGHYGSLPCYACEIMEKTQIPGGFTRSGVRELADIIPDEELAIAGLAVQIIDYDRTTRFCGRCGTKTKPVRTERAKVCPACHQITYPRLSPAIIVLVRKDNTILLARGKHAPPGRYSLVAGFVEPGETIEHAVHREVREETGISITNARYVASEPWPFPNSLMFGFIADYAGGSIMPDGNEIESAEWFDRNHLPEFPLKLSITRRLIDHWLSG
ncbi:NAD(+) diphosphatase [Methanoregula sp.]|uniref:NAD(+) diphosphatase n=1 Tax=Methanoregula sp. TaxID=2052170 RepID=UPI0035681E54